MERYWTRRRRRHRGPARRVTRDRRIFQPSSGILLVHTLGFKCPLERVPSSAARSPVPGSRAEPVFVRTSLKAASTAVAVASGAHHPTAYNVPSTNSPTGNDTPLERSRASPTTSAFRPAYCTGLKVLVQLQYRCLAVAHAVLDTSLSTSRLGWLRRKPPRRFPTLSPSSGYRRLLLGRGHCKVFESLVVRRGVENAAPL